MLLLLLLLLLLLVVVVLMLLVSEVGRVHAEVMVLMMLPHDLGARPGVRVPAWHGRREAFMW